MAVYAKNQKQIADHFNVSRPAVSKWAKSPDFPAKGPDGYDLQQIRTWRMTQQRVRITGSEPSESSAKEGQSLCPSVPSVVKDVPPLEISRARKEAAQAEIEEVKLARLNRELIPMDIVEKEWSTLLLRIRQRLIDLPSKTISRYHERMKRSELEKALRDEIDDTLAELATPPNYEDPE